MVVVAGLTLTAVPLVTARLPGVITSRAVGEELPSGWSLLLLRLLLDSPRNW